MGSLVPAMGLLAWGNARLVGYFKDDAFISLRYASHVAAGEGFVFNNGEQPLEGYSNFFWVVLEALGLWGGADPYYLASGLSMCFGVAAAVYCWLLAAEFGAPNRWSVAGLSAAALAVHPTLLLWSQGGLAGPLLATCFAATCYHLLRHRDGDLVWVVLWSLLACLVRPEGHVMWIAAGLFVALDRRRGNTTASGGFDARVIGVALCALLVFGAVAGGLTDSARTLGGQLLTSAPVVFAAASAFILVFVILRRVVGRLGAVSPLLLFLALSLPVLATYHSWRLSYFGDLFPNTSHVKTAGGWFLLGPGLKALGSLGLFCGGLPLLILAGLAVRGGFAKGLRLLMLSLVLVFAAYLVLIGGDEMAYYRIVLPAFPLLMVLATLGWHSTKSRISALLASRALWILPVLYGVSCLVVLESASSRFSSTMAGLRSAHQAMAQSVEERSAPGESIVFQDMGAAPFAADSLRWIDPIGLVDASVSRIRREYGVNPFHNDASSRDRIMSQVKFRARMRDYLFSEKPGWIAGVIYARRDEDKRALADIARLSLDPLKGGPRVRALLERSHHYHRVFADARFSRHYVFDSIWRRSPTYYLVLFRRR